MLITLGIQIYKPRVLSKENNLSQISYEELQVIAPRLPLSSSNYLSLKRKVNQSTEISLTNLAVLTKPFRIIFHR